MISQLLYTSAALFDIPDSNLVPLRGGHVAQVYGFTQRGRDYVLRLTPPADDLDFPSRQATLAWMAFLARHGASVPEPVASIHGNLIEVVPAEDGDWLATLQTRAPGVLSEELALNRWDAPLFQALGRSVGRMHAAARQYIPEPGAARPEWDQGGNLYNRPEFSEDWVERKAAGVLAKIGNLTKGPESYGMIHADLHFGNFFVDAPSRTITLFDFDDACTGWYVMDLAMLLFDILVLHPGPDREGFALDFLRPLLGGYLAENKLDPVWFTQLPVFAKLLEINIFGSLGPAYIPGKDWWMDKFMPGRRERIQNDVPYLNINFKTLERV